MAIFKPIIVIVTGEKGNVLADFKIVYSFEVDKHNEYLTHNGDSYTIDSTANNFLNNIVIATTRGVLYAELKGSFLDKSILPLTKPSKVNEPS